MSLGESTVGYIPVYWYDFQQNQIHNEEVVVSGI